MPKIFTLLIFLFAVSTLFAQTDTYYLHLAARPGVPIVQESSDANVQPSEVVDGYYYRIVQFHEIPSQQARQAMEEAGIRLLGYVPNRAYYMAIPAHLEEVEPLLPAKRVMLKIDRSYKLDPSVLQEPLPAYACTAMGIKVHVAFFSNLPIAKVRSVIESHGWRYQRLSTIGNIATLTIPQEELDALAHHPAVQYIELVGPPGQPENYNSAVVNRSALLNGTSHSPYKYDGAGTNVQLQDDGFIGPHIDHKNRIQEQFVTGNFGSHGDHTGGTIFGAGNRDPRGKGMAPGAQLFVYHYDEFNDSIVPHHEEYGINITSTSYSNGCNDGYTATARTHDMQVKQYPDLTHVFSAGNSNGQDCGYGAGPLWGNITGGHKVGKNVIAVANTNNYGEIASSSSRGPAYDGRIKPDISAKGTSVYSTVGNNSYDFNTGTSMSCPAVAGSIALLYEAYRENNSGEQPPSALIKNFMLNTATDLGNPGPDFIYGWGMMNTFQAVKMVESENYATDSLAHGQEASFAVTVPENSSEARFMLYWHDEPAAQGAAKALVNDLDLKVVSPGGDTLLPLVLNSYPDHDSLDMPAQPGEDHLNNMEQVFIELPDTGHYELLVRGTEVPEESQQFYLSWYLPERALELTYPNGGEHISPMDDVVISWESFARNNAEITLSYSADSGNTWEQIATGLTADVLSYEWSVPPTLSGPLLFKVSSGSYEDVSDSFFTIIRAPQELEVTRVCCQSFQLSWAGMAEADSFTVYVLDSLYMQPAGTTTNTYFDITEYNGNEEVWVTVSAHSQGGEGPRALAIEKPEEPFGCNQAGNIALTAITSPGNGIISPCIYEDSIPVQLIISNFSDTGVEGATLSFDYKGSLYSYELNDTIPANGQLQVDFPRQIPVPAPGDHSLTAWISNTLDFNPCDDTATANFRVIAQHVATVPYFEDLEGNLPCSEFPNCGMTHCSIVGGLVNAPNGLSDDIDWRVDLAGTPSNFTGPSMDHNPGEVAGKYIYLEASGECTGKVAILQLPCMDLTTLNQPKFKFWYHMYGEEMGSLALEVNDGSGWQPLVELTGNAGNFWRPRTVNLAPFVGEVVVLRFVGVTGIGFTSDMALDDFSLIDDVAIEATIQSPDTICTGASLEVEADVNTPVSGVKWDFGEGATPATASTQDPGEVIFNDAGLHVITVTLNRPYDSATFSKEILVTGPPVTGFDFFPQGYKTIQFVNTTEDANEYKWHFGDGATSNEASPFHQYADTTRQQVTLVAGRNGCSDTLSKTISLTKAGYEDQVMLLYPNPAGQRIYIQFIAPALSGVELQMMDATGKIIWDESVDEIELNRVEVDVSALAAGVYFVKATLPEGNYLQRFVISRN